MSPTPSSSSDGGDDARNSESRARLLEAASRLFVRKGFSGVSIREIAEAAETNSALIAYYFGDKQGLFLEAFKLAAEPVNDERMRRFRALGAKDRLTVEQVVEAWIEPMFASGASDRELPVAGLSLSLTAEYGKLSEQMTAEVYDEMNENFLQLLERCLPDVSRATLVWRLYFLVGAGLTAARQRAASMKRLSGGVLDGRSHSQMMRHLIAFAAAGFRAAEPKASTPGEMTRARPTAARRR